MALIYSRDMKSIHIVNQLPLLVVSFTSLMSVYVWPTCVSKIVGGLLKSLNINFPLTTHYWVIPLYKLCWCLP